MLSAGNQHVAFVTRDGFMWMWGNVADVLDNELRASILRPERLYSLVGGRSAAVMVACGRDCTLLLTETDGVWGFGSGDRGQMGLRHTNFYKYHHDKTQIQPACFVGVDTTWTSIIRVGMIGMGQWEMMAVVFGHGETTKGVNWDAIPMVNSIITTHQLKSVQQRLTLSQKTLLRHQMPSNLLIVSRISPWWSQPVVLFGRVEVETLQRWDSAHTWCTTHFSASLGQKF